MGHWDIHEPFAIGLLLPPGVNAKSGFHRLEPWAFLLIYLIVIPLLVIVLLWLPHRTMIRAREAYMKEWEDTVKTDSLAELDKQRDDETKAFPVWPIRIPLLARLAGMVTGSFIGALVAFVFNLLVKPDK